MRFDSFLSSPRWEILQILATRPSSPMELAASLQTTVAYMSQQLQLLDAANLITKEKTGAAEKGKPRSLFHISKDMVYFVSLAKNFADKKLILATEHHKSILKIWLIEDVSLHYYFEKLYWKLDEDKNEIEAIFLDIGNSPKMVIISDSKKIKTKIDVFISSFQRKIDFTIIQKNQLKKQPGKLVSLYDPSFLEEELKGGNTGNNE